MFARRRRFFPGQIKFITRLLCCLLFTPFLVNSIAAKEPIAIIDLTSDGTVSQASIDMICSRIAKAISVNNRFEVIDRKYMPFTLQGLGLPQHPRCSEVACLSDIGKAIGALYIIGGSIRIEKKKILIMLNYVNSETGKAIKTIKKKMSVEKEEFINKKVPLLVQELMPALGPTAAAKATDVASIENTCRDGGSQAKTDDSSEKNSSPDASIKSKRSNTPLVILGSAIAAVGAAVAVYIKLGKKSSTTPPGEGDLSIRDAPTHTR
jgi:TolB-like protein